MDTEIIRSLIQDIVLTPVEGRVEVDLYGDLAGILTLATNKKDGPLDESDPSVLQVKLVAGARNHRYRHSLQTAV